MSRRTSPRNVIVPCCGWQTPLITFSIELLLAPLGPMMARISCSRTSKLIPVSAFTPPNESEILSSSSTTAPLLRAVLMRWSCPSRCLARDGRGQGFGFLYPQVGGHHAAAAILELHQRFHVLHVLVRIKRIDQLAVLFGDEAAAHLARARELVVVGVELFVQDDEAMDLRRGERALTRELGVDLLHAFA